MTYILGPRKKIWKDFSYLTSIAKALRCRETPRDCVHPSANVPENKVVMSNQLVWV